MAGNVNSIRDESFIQQYLFKLVPDFGVFDIAEKYFIDGNLSDGEQQLFFYKRKTVENETIGTTFRRAIFKFDKDISIEEKSKNITLSSDNILKYEINKRYLILINELSPISFTIGPKDTKIIGVCF